MSRSSAEPRSPPPTEPTAIKIDDPGILRPDFYRTTKAGSERQRLALACQTCRQKKVKCDGELPKCHRCTHLSLECEYKLTTHRRSRPQGANAVKKRSMSNTSSQHASPIITQPSLASENWPTSHFRPDEDTNKRARSERRSPFTNNASAQDAGTGHFMHDATTGSSMRAKSAVPSLYNSPSGITHNPLQAQIRNHIPDISIRYKLPPPLPSHRLLIELCQIYFSRVYGQMYSFLHRPSFMRKVVERPRSLNPALLLAICAVSSRFHQSADPVTLETNAWASASIATIFDVDHYSLDTDTLPKSARNRPPRACLSSVQALHLVAYHYFGQGRSLISWLLLSFGIRMAESLNLNREFYDDPIGQPGNHPNGYIVNFTDREIRRRTFWSLYMMDRISSAGVRRPFTISNADISIQLPVRQDLFDREIPSYTANFDDLLTNSPVRDEYSMTMDFFAFLIRIIDIWGEVCSFVQQAQSELNWSSGSPLVSLRQKVLAWEECLPQDMKYSAGSTRVQLPGWYLMHTAYFLSLCVMHRYALPKSPTKQYGVDHVPVDYLNMCVKEAIYNAIRVSDVIHAIPESVSISAPFLGFAAFSAGSLHAFLGFHIPDMDSVMAAKNRAYVHTTLAFLTRLGEAWKPISRMREALSSQIRRPRSTNSILNECAVDQFRVPDSLPIKFTTQQQIEMNSLAFSHWFDDPSGKAPWVTPVDLVAPNNGSTFTNAASTSDAAFTQPYDPNIGARSSTSFPTPPQKSIRPRDSSNTPYGPAFPIVSLEDAGNDSVVADLLVSFKQADQSPHGDGDSRSMSHLDTHDDANEPPGLWDYEVAREQFVDQLDSLREMGSPSATVDCLQLMKVGLITALNWGAL